MNILKSAALHLHDHFVPSARNNYKPHLVAHRSLSLYAALLISARLLTFLSLDLLPQNQAFSSAVSIRNILELTNYSRESYGLNQLTQNNLLDQAAQAKAEDMVQNQYFAHTSPQGATAWNFIKDSGYNYVIAGENLAINFYSSEGVSQAWMNSPEHKANILNRDFQDIGIGIAEGVYHGVKAIWVVQMFGASVDRPYLPQNQFSAATPLQQNTSVHLPTASQISLQRPVINDPGFYLTNKKTIDISGIAQGATTLYVLVNHQPQEEFTVSSGQFNGKVQLAEGANTITVVGFNDFAQASPISASLDLKLDSSAPNILTARLLPAYNGHDTVYRIEVQAQSDTTKILASLGPSNILLQPGASPNTWVGSFIAGDSQLQNQLTISAYDLAGNSTLSRVATFAAAPADNYGFAAQHNFAVQVFGHDFSLNSFNGIYIYFILAMLVLLGITIAVRRDVQHVGLIAHASGMIVLAVVFWLI